MSRERALGPDALRLFGFVAIVVGHAVPVAWVREALYPWHVAVFFFLAGYFWRPDRSVLAELRQRWTTLMVPYFAWLLLITGPLLAYEAATRTHRQVVRRGESLLEGGTAIASPYQAFWFLCALFVAALLYRSAHNALGARTAQLLSLLVLPLTFLGPSLSDLPYSLGVGVMGVFFIGAGHLARDHADKLRPWWPAFLLVGSGLVAARVVTPMDMKQGNWGTPVLGFVAAVLISAGLLGLFEQLFRSGGPRWISTAASLGLILVLTHGVPIYLIAYRLPWFVTVGSALAFGALLTVLCRNQPWLGGRARAGGARRAVLTAGA